MFESLSKSGVTTKVSYNVIGRVNGILYDGDFGNILLCTYLSDPTQRSGSGLVDGPVSFFICTKLCCLVRIEVMVVTKTVTVTLFVYLHQSSKCTVYTFVSIAWCYSRRMRQYAHNSSGYSVDSLVGYRTRFWLTFLTKA